MELQSWSSNVVLVHYTRSVLTVSGITILHHLVIRVSQNYT